MGWALDTARTLGTKDRPETTETNDPTHLPRSAALSVHRSRQALWLEIVQIALDLLAWMPMLALTGKARLWEHRRLRFRLFSTAVSAWVAWDRTGGSWGRRSASTKIRRPVRSVTTGARKLHESRAPVRPWLRLFSWMSARAA